MTRPADVLLPGVLLTSLIYGCSSEGADPQGGDAGTGADAGPSGAAVPFDPEDCVNTLSGVVLIEDALSAAALRSVDCVDDLHLEGELLTSVADLSALRFVNGDLTIVATGLSDLRGLEGLDRVVGRLVIQRNVELGSLSGLGSLRRAGEVWIDDSSPAARLGNLTGLEGLTVIDDSLTLDGAYDDLRALRNLREVGDLHVRAAVSDGLAGLEGITEAGLVTLRGSVTDLRGLANLAAVGVLEIENTNLVDLDGLQALTRIRTGLTIRHCPELASLAAIDPRLAGQVALEPDALASVRIEDNASLSECAHRHFLDSVGLDWAPVGAGLQACATECTGASCAP